MNLTAEIIRKKGRLTGLPDCPVSYPTLISARQGKMSEKTKILLEQWLDIKIDIEPKKRLPLYDKSKKGNPIYKFRMKKGLSMGALAIKIGLDLSAISFHESGKRGLSEKSIEKYSKVIPNFRKKWKNYKGGK
jgi:hypothetical protein